MAIFHSCCLCCNLRTGSCIAGIYSIVSTIFYMILLIIRNVGFELVQEYEVHAGLTYSSIGILSAFIIASVILIIGVLMDNILLYVMWVLMAPITLVFSTISLCYIVIYDLQNDIPVEGWEQAFIIIHLINTVFMIACILGVYSQFYDLYRGKGTAAYHLEMELAQEQAIATMFGLDMGLGDDEMMGVSNPAGPVRPLDPPAYLGVPPPAYSDLSSRRTQQQSRTGITTENQQTTGNTENSTSGERANQPQSNPASGDNTPASTLRSESTARSRPRPSYRPPPSEMSVDSMDTSRSLGAPGSMVYLNFDLESEDGRSTTSRPTTLLRNEAVARIMVNDTVTESGRETEASDTATVSGHHDNNDNTNTANTSSSIDVGETRSGSAEESGSRSNESRARSRRIREGVTRDGSTNNNRFTSGSRTDDHGNRPDRPSRRGTNNNARTSQERATTPIPDYTLEQPSRGSGRRPQQQQQQQQQPQQLQQVQSTEPPPPYHTIDPNRRPSRDELEAQVYAQAHALAQVEYMMRQRSREYEFEDPGWYEFDDHPPPPPSPDVMDPYYGAYP